MHGNEQIAESAPSTDSLRAIRTSAAVPNYLNEFEFRWNTRKLDDGQRVVKAIKQVDGKRLMYRESVDNPPYLVPAFEFRLPKQADAPLDDEVF